MNKNIELSESELTLLILNYLRNEEKPNLNLVALILSEQLMNTELGVQNLIKAMHGLSHELSDHGISIGDIIKVEQHGISGQWGWDLGAMEDAGIIINGCIECEVIGFNRTNTNCIEVSYSFIEDSSKKLKAYQSTINPKNIRNEKSIDIDDAFKHKPK